MAEEKKPARKSGKEEFYDKSSKSKTEPQKHGAEPRRTGDGPLNVNEMLGRHAAEREGMRKAHESERRDEHNRQRDEHRSVNARHEAEYNNG